MFRWQKKKSGQKENGDWSKPTGTNKGLGIANAKENRSNELSRTSFRQVCGEDIERGLDVDFVYYDEK